MCLDFDKMQKLMNIYSFLEQQIPFKFQHFSHGNKNHLPSISIVQITITEIFKNIFPLALYILPVFLDKKQGLPKY